MSAMGRKQTLCAVLLLEMLPEALVQILKLQEEAITCISRSVAPHISLLKQFPVMLENVSARNRWVGSFRGESERELHKLVFGCVNLETIRPYLHLSEIRCRPNAIGQLRCISTRETAHLG